MQCLQDVKRKRNERVQYRTGGTFFQKRRRLFLGRLLMVDMGILWMESNGFICRRRSGNLDTPSSSGLRRDRGSFSMKEAKKPTFGAKRAIEIHQALFAKRETLMFHWQSIVTETHSTKERAWQFPNWHSVEWSHYLRHLHTNVQRRPPTSLTLHHATLTPTHHNPATSSCIKCYYLPLTTKTSRSFSFPYYSLPRHSVEFPDHCSPVSVADTVVWVEGFE